ncbi:MAG: type II toxin-antitoxin system RelE/ParE family toxin [Candidatus Omnitrophota bacterium]|nr:type II toxin-antitoxin system RelE/ParE family toxin [Candidatus Omnitrophota bacterium]
MGYEVFYHPDIVKDLERIPRNIKETIKRAIEERLTNNPGAVSEPLKRDLKGYRKLRVGDYRVISRIQGNSICILKIGNRKNVYAGVFGRLSWGRREK